MVEALRRAGALRDIEPPDCPFDEIFGLGREWLTI